MALPIALQLYTVRDVMNKDYEGALKQVADIGYKHVEMAGLGKNSPEQVRAMLDKLGLKAISSHGGFERLRDDVQAVINEARVLGYDMIGCPYIPARTLTEYREAVKVFNTAAKVIKDAGMTFFYHNHSFEFAPIEEGRRGMDVIFSESDPKLVNSELDVYWVQHGGQDPVAWIKKLSGRLPLLHIKDMEKGEKRGFAEVGTGVLNFQAILEAAPAAGVRAYIIEQDNGWIDGDPMKSAKISFQNFSKMVK